MDWLLTVHERVGSIRGGPLASSLALAGFLSLFPLLVVGIAVIGYLSAGDSEFAQDVTRRLGLEGDAADTVLDAIDSAEDTRRASTVIGLAGLAWTGLAAVGAAEAALNAAWQAEPRGMKGKPRAVLWLVVVGVALLASGAGSHLLTMLPGPTVLASVPAGLAIDTLLLLALFAILSNVRVGWRAHLPGAVTAAVGLGALKVMSSIYLPRLIESSSLYGSIGVVFALLAWFLLMARLIVYAAVINVVVYEKRHGTVTAEIRLPRFPGQVALATTRGGALDESVGSPTTADVMAD